MKIIRNLTFCLGALLLIAPMPRAFFRSCPNFSQRPFWARHLLQGSQCCSGTCHGASCETGRAGAPGKGSRREEKGSGRSGSDAGEEPTEFSPVMSDGDHKKLSFATLGKCQSNYGEVDISSPAGKVTRFTPSKRAEEEGASEEDRIISTIIGLSTKSLDIEPGPWKTRCPR
jgi:hypothetical protein